MISEQTPQSLSKSSLKLPSHKVTSEKVKPKVELSHLRKIFHDSIHHKDVFAVNDFHLQIQEGELVTLLGPSGCGKTTVLRMLAGFETPTAGEILLNSQDITALPPNQRNSALVFQSYALFPHMSVEENIGYGLKLRKIKGADYQEKLQKVLKTVGLDGLQKRSPNALSGGQQQRVALARALVVEPEILLFDEPLSNLDARLRESMRFEIRKIQKSLSITALYVTHDQTEAMAISDRIVVMKEGNIEQVGTPTEIYFRPQTRFVADFVGAANFLPAQIEALASESVRVEVLGHSFEIPYRHPAVREKQSVTLVVRPENILLRAPDESAWKGRVLSTHYLGGMYQYEIDLQRHSQKLLAQEEATPFQVPLKAGETVGIALREDRLHYLCSEKTPLRASYH